MRPNTSASSGSSVPGDVGGGESVAPEGRRDGEAAVGGKKLFRFFKTLSMLRIYFWVLFATLCCAEFVAETPTGEGGFVRRGGLRRIAVFGTVVT